MVEHVFEYYDSLESEKVKLVATKMSLIPSFLDGSYIITMSMRHWVGFGYAGTQG